MQIHDNPASFAAPSTTNGTAAAASAEIAEAKKAEELKLKQAVVTVDKGKKCNLHFYPSLLMSVDSLYPTGSSAARKAEKEEEEEVVAPVVDLDPVGELLLQTKEPLVQALKFLRPLEKAAPEQVQTWVLSYEVAIRRGLSFHPVLLLEIIASLTISLSRKIPASSESLTTSFRHLSFLPSSPSPPHKILNTHSHTHFIYRSEIRH